MAECRIEEGEAGETCALRVSGRATWREARACEALLKAAAARGAAIVLDLGACDYLDSTFLGILARSSRTARAAGREWRIACVAEGARRALASLGLSSLLPDSSADRGPDIAWKPVAGATASGREEASFVLAAHEELEAASPENVGRFDALKEALRKPPPE